MGKFPDCAKKFWFSKQRGIYFSYFKRLDEII